MPPTIAPSSPSSSHMRTPLAHVSTPSHPHLSRHSIFGCMPIWLLPTSDEPHHAVQVPEGCAWVLGMRPRLLAFAKDASSCLASQGVVVHCLARASRDDSLACGLLHRVARSPPSLACHGRLSHRVLGAARRISRMPASATRCRTLSHTSSLPSRSSLLPLLASLVWVGSRLFVFVPPWPL
ncbi:hypothetical protein EXIGLDRAFT_783882 [Exidia glandulosa HHB12029]|uniref:Uncharacterized protein n=1 Tax=Exidia glandulosa HHB12029 TaxID=1314781 RepID=A0A166MU56_EXIGL|nr:hypothetical protein EXIGLDRAFT_783882 [Exidia glandulosa HHB12029]